MSEIARLAAAMSIMFLSLVHTSYAQTLAPLTPQPEDVAWPTTDWETGALPDGTASTVNRLITDAMGRELDDTMGETRAIVIIHQGRLVAEVYRDGFTPETKQISWSMAKSVTHALVGRAVHLGLIEDIDAAMPSPFAADDPRREITWRHWLNMTDGLDYLEIGAASLEESDVVQMMFGPGRFDVIQHVIDELPPIHAPGAHWNYSTAGYHMIGRALQRLDAPIGWRSERRKAQSLNDILDSILEDSKKLYGSVEYEPHQTQIISVTSDTLQSFENDIQAGLFTPLGIDAQPEFDPAGTFLGGSLVWASPRDFAKFGYLYLRDGVWEGERLLPEGWVDFARTETPGTNSNIYGAGWWITAYGEEPTHVQAVLTPPWDAFHAGGHEGQTIWVVPSRDLVIVRLGLMDNAGENWPALYEWNQEVARAFPGVE